MRGLKICLWVAGVMCLLSVIGMFLPISVWESISGAFGVELVLPDSPVWAYAVRLMSATSAVIGVYLLILALDPMRYGVMVPFTGIAALLLGICAGVVGLATGMPALWFLGDCLSCTVMGILVLVFWKRARAMRTE